MSRNTAAAIRAEQPWLTEGDIYSAAACHRVSGYTLPALCTLVLLLVGVTPFFMVDRVVSTDAGTIISTEPLVTFQALDPSLIKSIDVKEGQTVEKGQLLATLDPTFAAADVDQLRQQVASLDAQITRAEAEQNKVPLVFPADAPPEEKPFIALQTRLFNQKAASFAAQMKSFDEKIKTTQVTIAKLQNDENRYSERQKITQQIEDMRNTLYKSGASSLLSLLQATDAQLEMQRTHEFGKNSLIEAQHQLSSLQADREASVQQWFSTGSQELFKARNDRDTALASLMKATKHKELVHWVAPEAAVVLKLAKLSVGSVLSEGQELMTLVPLRAPLEAEIHFSADNIGFVHPGDAVTLKVDAFNYLQHGTVEGKLRWISEGSFTTNEDDAQKPVDPYYKARVKIEKINLVRVPENFRLIPGMTLQADINTGVRSVVAYVMSILGPGAGEAMHEP